jgi:predicted pyridoxine 5'-phosphate oxidase superfamily flavin-nucleotide-binding protein
MVPGSNNVIRINGRAIVTADETLRDRLGRGDIRPATVIVIEIKEVYSQCARALVRSRLWTAGEESQGLPTVGQILAAMTDDEVGGERYDAEWAGRAIKTLW